MTDLFPPLTGSLPTTPIQQTLLEYQTILENASVGILFSRDQRVLHCNPEFSKIFGWPQGELVGQHGSVFYLSPQDYAEIGRIASPILSTGGAAGPRNASAPQGRQHGLVPHACQGHQPSKHR